MRRTLLVWGIVMVGFWVVGLRLVALGIVISLSVTFIRLGWWKWKHRSMERE